MIYKKFFNQTKPKVKLISSHSPQSVDKDKSKQKPNDTKRTDEFPITVRIHEEEQGEVEQGAQARPEEISVDQESAFSIIERFLKSDSPDLKRVSKLVKDVNDGYEKESAIYIFLDGSRQLFKRDKFDKKHLRCLVEVSNTIITQLSDPTISARYAGDVLNFQIEYGDDLEGALEFAERIDQDECEFLWHHDYYFYNEAKFKLVDRILESAGLDPEKRIEIVKRAKNLHEDIYGIEENLYMRQLEKFGEYVAAVLESKSADLEGALDFAKMVDKEWQLSHDCFYNKAKFKLVDRVIDSVLSEDSEASFNADIIEIVDKAKKLHKNILKIELDLYKQQSERLEQLSVCELV